MRATFAAVAFAALAAANPLPQASSGGCSGDYSGTFEIQVVDVTSKVKRQNTPLVMTLKGGVLTDSQGRTGYVAANSQFQFDSPPQAGALETSGFEVCADGNLALNGDETWYKCLSGTFYNLYDNNDAGQCSPVNIKAVGSGAPAPAASTPAPVPTSSAAPTTSAYPAPSATAVASQIPDGQVTAATVPVVTQISDGQIQATTGTPVPVCTEYVDGQPQCAAPTPVPVCSQIGDGQPQCGTGTITPSYYAPTGAPVPSYTGPAIATGAGNMVTPFAGLLAGALGLAALL